MPLRSRAVLPLTLLALAFPATATASITEFTGLTTGIPSGGITAGPDGAVWFTIGGTPGGIGQIRADGSITEHGADVLLGLTRESDAADIVAGPDGALWFTERAGTGAIGRFDPVTETLTEYTDGLTPDSDPGGITVGPDGNLWFTETAKGAIGRISPEGEITEFSSGLSGSSEPTDIAAGADGNLWFTVADDAGAIGRIDPGTGEITEFNDGLTPGSAPAGITAGSDGKLFFTQPGASRIGKVKTDGTIYEYAAGIARGARPTGIAEGGDGALWFTTARASGPLGRLWPQSGAIQQLTGGLTASLEPGGITRGPDGNIWYTIGTPPGIGRVTVPPKVAIGTPLAHEGRVKLKGGVTANSQATTYFFEYGREGALDAQTVATAAGADAGEVGVSQLVDLERGAGYQVRITAANASGTTVSSSKRFYLTLDGKIEKEKPAEEGTATVVEQPRSPLKPPAVAVLPPAAPVIGHSVNVAPVTGTVRVRPPGADRFAPLDAGASIRVGSLVDARAGRVELVSARPAGEVQNGTFWGGIFQVRQPRDGRGMTDLVLRGGGFGRCPDRGTRGVRARAAGVTRDAGRRSVVRRLWGKDRHARFRTHGRDSVATVRGTVWATVDRCDGTLTRVKEGKVLVRDERTKRRVLLTAGRSYLARHRR